MELLASATEKIPAVIPAMAGPAAAAAPPLLSIPSEALDLVLKLVSHWSYASRLPGLDLLRCMCPAEAVAEYSDSRRGSIVDIVIASATTGVGSADAKLVENSIMMALRAIANLFATEAGRSVVAAQADQVVALMECILGISPDAVGDVGGPIGVNNRNVLIALTSAAINLGVLAHSQEKAAAEAKVGEEALTLLLNVVGKVLTLPADSEVAFRALVALAMVVDIPNSQYAETAKSLGATDWVKGAQARAGEDRVRGLAGAVLRRLR